MIVSAQQKNPPKQKAPTQKEMQEMMKEAQRQMEETVNEMSQEDKRMMDSMGIKMPDFSKTAKDVSGVSNKDLKGAWEEDGAILPRKNPARIAAIPSPIAPGQMAAYIKSTNQKALDLYSEKELSIINRMLNDLNKKNSTADYSGNAAIALWVMGYPRIAFGIMASACEKDISNANNLNNYAAMLTMLGGAQLAIPLLNDLNKNFPKNNTILNNIGQAWLQLGDISKGEKYIDSTLQLYPAHSKALMAKALIEESRGKKAEATALIKKSIKSGYSVDKEQKLKSLGVVPDPKEDKFPMPKKPDPLNLGGFTPPPFPKTVNECLALEPVWNQFRADINSELATLEQQIQEGTQKVAEANASRMQKDAATIQASQQAGQITGAITQVPIYHQRAVRNLNADAEIYGRKMNDWSLKVKSFFENVYAPKTADYNEKIKKLQKEEIDQTGEGKPNADFCPKFREAADAYLKVVNTEKELLFKEQLRIEKDFINNSTHWRMFTDFPETFEVAKLGAKRKWLELLSAKAPIAFESITKYKCDPPPQNKPVKLSKFDDVACKYNDTLRLVGGKIISNCSKLKGEFDMDFLAFKIVTDSEAGEGFMEQFVSGAIEVGFKKGIEKEVGPVKIEASAGVRVGVEIDRTGITDFIVGGGVEAGVELIGTPTGTSAGISGKMGLISGTGSIKGEGVFEKLK